MNRILLTAGLIALLMPVAWAQRDDEGRDGDRRGDNRGEGDRRIDERRERMFEAMAEERDAREMVEMVMMVRISRDLKLTEDESVLLVRRMSEVRSEIGDAYRQRRGATGKLRKAIDSGDDESVLSALAELKALDSRIEELKLGAHERVAEGLTAKQQARLYLYLQEYEENMQRMVQRVRERSRMMDDGRGGPPPPQRRMMREGPQDGGDTRRGDGDRGPRRPESDAPPGQPKEAPHPQPERPNNPE